MRSCRWAVKPNVLVLWVLLAALSAACTSKSPVAPGTTRVSVKIVFNGLTTRRTDLTRTQEDCARFVGPTHAHASWRNFESVNMTAVGADRWEVTFDDAPVGPAVSVMIGDQNACVTDPDGWVIRDVLANGVALTQVVTVNNGKGLGLTVASDGRVTP